MKEKNVFISWTGSAGKRIANALARIILDYPGLSTFVSSRDILVGSDWRKSIDNALKEASAIVVCLTPGASRRSWVNFEAGFAYSRIENVKIITFDEMLPQDSPLNTFQAADGHKREGLVSLLSSIILDESKAQKYIDYKYKDWQDEFSTILPQKIKYGTFQEAETRLLESIDSMSLHENSQHPYLQKMVTRTIDDLCHQIQSVKNEQSFSMPYVLYPHTLVSILREFKPIVKAVAIIEKDEHFWQEKIADEICDSTPKDSTRLFVFRDQKQFRSYLPTIIRHANKYNVLAMSYENLVRDFDVFSSDFSIMGGSENRLAAYYDDNIEPRRMIRFSADPTEISKRDDAFNEMIGKAVAVLPEERLDVDKLVEAIFKFTTHEHKKVEMSTYIQILDYDTHEEEHAYYIDMMERMRQVFRNHRGGVKSLRVLELGAGTGIFTRRLARVPGTHVVAIELDWACYVSLKHHADKMEPELTGGGSSIICMNEDSRFYNPSGVFRYVFSSFADHHIRPSDKRKYFHNVKQNLEHGGLFIVGDEFLPHHDPRNAEARRAALRTYHGHIIEVAREGGQSVLVQLEEAALESGLREIGDFKLSCEHYEELVADSGLKVIDKKKMGPLGRDDLGGVYVYVMEKV